MARCAPVQRGEAIYHGDQLVCLRGTHQDVTDRKGMEGRLAYQADHDPLTGLLQPASLRRGAGAGAGATRRAPARAGAVLMVDVDNFKLLNDARGLTAGDAALRRSVATLAAPRTDTDVVARLSATSSRSRCRRRGRGRRLAPTRSVRLGLARRDGERRRTVSIGVALFDGAAGRLGDDALAAADIALCEAKEGGRDQVRVYRGEATTALRWVARDRRALDQDRLVLYAQPMVDLAAAGHAPRAARADAVRRRRPRSRRGASCRRPSGFGLIGEIDRWVVHEGLPLARGGRARSRSTCRRSRSATRGSSTRVWQAVDGDDDGRERHRSRSTETAAVTNMDGRARFAAALSELGCDVALDDFGTGFGSFTYLKHLPRAT